MSLAIVCNVHILIRCEISSFHALTVKSDQLKVAMPKNVTSDI